MTLTDELQALVETWRKDVAPFAAETAVGRAVIECADELAAVLAKHATPCVWKIDDFGGDSEVPTECNESFYFEGDPPHDWMKFCCYCGKPVQFAYTSAGHAGEDTND